MEHGRLVWIRNLTLVKMVVVVVDDVGVESAVYLVDLADLIDLVEFAFYLVEPVDPVNSV